VCVMNAEHLHTALRPAESDLSPLDTPDVLALQFALGRYVLTTDSVDVVQRHDVGQIHRNKSTTATTRIVM